MKNSFFRWNISIFLLLFWLAIHNTFQNYLMSDVFDTCESNFLKNIRFVQKALQETDQSNTKIAEMNECLIDATQQLNKMEIEFGICQSQDMRAKINLYKGELRNYKKRTNDQARQIKVTKEHLSDQMFDKEEEVGVNPLLEAKRQMYENQELSREAAQGIKKNNQALMRNIDRMGDINANLNVAQKLLGSIGRKMKKNKFVLYGTILILFVVIIFVIYTYVG